MSIAYLKKAISLSPSYGIPVYPPADPDYVSGTYTAEVSIWYRDTWGETATFDTVINIGTGIFKKAIVNVECYANNGSGGNPYVRLDIKDENGNIIRTPINDTRNPLGQTWNVAVECEGYDIVNGVIRLHGTAFGCVYSPDNPSWCERRITISSIALYNK